MHEKDKSKLRASLIEAIDSWFSDESENDIDLPWIGDNTIAYIADAALSAIWALHDAQEYIKREGVFEETSVAKSTG